MKIKNKRLARRILLTAAELIAIRAEYIASHAGTRDPVFGAGNRFCCLAINDASAYLRDPEAYDARVFGHDGGDRATELKGLLFETFPQNAWGYVWASDALDTEERILGLLLLREMLK
jgi:hypothetical protein